MKFSEERVKGKEDVCDLNSKRRREGKVIWDLPTVEEKHPGTGSKALQSPSRTNKKKFTTWHIWLESNTKKKILKVIIRKSTSKEQQ